MKKVSYTNETRNFQHVGGVTVPPGETRDVDPSLLPDYQSEGAAPEAPPRDPLAEMMTGSVKVISAELVHLSDEDLARALQLEQEGLSRKSMLEAITVENLRRVAEKPSQPEAAKLDAGQPDPATLDSSQSDQGAADTAKEEGQ